MSGTDRAGQASFAYGRGVGAFLTGLAVIEGEVGWVFVVLFAALSFTEAVWNYIKMEQGK